VSVIFLRKKVKEKKIKKTMSWHVAHS